MTRTVCIVFEIWNRGGRSSLFLTRPAKYIAARRVKSHRGHLGGRRACGVLRIPVFARNIARAPHVLTLRAPIKEMRRPAPYLLAWPVSVADLDVEMSCRCGIKSSRHVLRDNGVENAWAARPALGSFVAQHDCRYRRGIMAVLLKFSRPIIGRQICSREIPRTALPSS